MVNDLAVTHNNRWKYVDDTSLSETIIKGKQSHLQTVIDAIEKWCTENDMVLNDAKYKELIISFAKDTPNFRPLFVGEHCISRVSSAKSLVLFSCLIFIGTCILNTSWQKHQRDYTFSEYLSEAELSEFSILLVRT